MVESNEMCKKVKIDEDKCSNATLKIDFIWLFNKFYSLDMVAVIVVGTVL